MNRISESFLIQDQAIAKQQMLNWANRFNICCFLDNHEYHSAHGNIECLAAAGVHRFYSPAEKPLSGLDEFIHDTNDWLFGHLGYELKNELYPTSSSQSDSFGFPALYFFQPEIVVELNHNRLTISSLTKSPGEIFAEIIAVKHEQPATMASVNILPRMSREAYIEHIEKILLHIKRGDCYELNYCQEFYAHHALIHPLNIYLQLTRISPNPFSCFYKLDDKYVLCASPERYLQKKGNRLLSQPMKGTFKRNLSNAADDFALKTALQESEKERSENVMVVDLVRNDLSKICAEGTVRVDELFGVYSFPQVHQMVSSITGMLKDGTSFHSILKASFPMGSMTGAPKKKVLELIEQYEKTGRGVYSGSIGYIHPNGDFDFNVVIRSILYNAVTQYLSYHVGSGITFYSNPEKEYEECLLKAAAIKEVLEQS